MGGARAEIGVFGGSGLYELLDDARELSLDTPYGPPSAPVRVGEVAGRQVAFLPRHGARHEYPPHRINYRANLWAMKELGVRGVLAPCASGSLKPDIAPGDFVVPDQLVDRTWGRADTFYDGPVTYHASLADPYCPALSGAAISAGRAEGLTVHAGGTVVTIQGPRFATRAESHWYRSAGWDVINMTQYPEVALARELGICYAAIALITDYDVGVDDVAPVTQDEVFGFFDANVERVRALLLRLVGALPEPCTDIEPGPPITTQSTQRRVDAARTPGVRAVERRHRSSEPPSALDAVPYSTPYRTVASPIGSAPEPPHEARHCVENERVVPRTTVAADHFPLSESHARRCAVRHFPSVRSARRARGMARAGGRRPDGPPVGRSRVPLHRRLLGARSAVPYWMAVGILALITGAVVARLVDRTAAAERRLGATRAVAVATQPLVPGRPLGSSTVRLESRPTADVPRNALTQVPTGATVADRVEAREIITASRLAGRPSRVPAGRSTMAVPAGQAPLLVRPGERVDLYASFAPDLAPGGTTSLVAARAIVVSAGRTAVTVAVRSREAPPLATALAQGTVTMALVR